MNLQQLHKTLGTQAKCIAHLEKLRWGKKPKCIFCESKNVKKRPKTMRWHCNDCKKDYSVLVGTIFEGTRHLQKNAFDVMLANAVKEESCLLNYKPKGNPRNS